MKIRANVIPIQRKESFASSAHRVVMGGEIMEVKHIHPDYADDNERLERLKDLSKACLEQLKMITNPEKTA